ncbi:MAG: fructosamine kinase family protein [Lysobacterales bacterium]
MSLLESIQTGLSESVGKVTGLHWVRDLRGGDINRAALVRSGEKNWFVKYRSNAPAGMFEAEALALEKISATGSIRVPEAIALGVDNGTSWLVLEYLELTSSGPAELLGEQLAAMHQISGDSFGWPHNNYIGITPQLNQKSDNWIDFWRGYRLKPQLAMAQTAGFSSRLSDKGERLLENLDQLLQGHEPAASLLHGDLWSGNKAFTPAGQPVIFDPASYYGDRETDLAMTELFGGFGPAFYAAYKAHSPLPDGYPLRRELYNLYHMLNHLNLFGAGYLSRCESIIDELLAQIS